MQKEKKNSLNLISHFIPLHFVLFVSFRFISFRFISFRFVSFRFVSFRFVSFCFVLFCFVLFCFVSNVNNTHAPMGTGSSLFTQRYRLLYSSYPQNICSSQYCCGFVDQLPFICLSSVDYNIARDNLTTS